MSSLPGARIKEEILYNTWHTYIRPFIQSEFDDEVIEELEEREFLCGDFTTEESEMLAAYEEKLREEYQSRLGGVVMQEEICNYIEKEYGIRPERKAIGRNLKRLREDFGMDICTDRKGSW